MTPFALGPKSSTEETLPGTPCKQGNYCIKAGRIYYGMPGGNSEIKQENLGSVRTYYGMFWRWAKGRTRDGLRRVREENGGG